MSAGCRAAYARKDSSWLLGIGTIAEKRSWLIGINNVIDSRASNYALGCIMKISSVLLDLSYKKWLWRATSLSFQG